MNKFLYHTSLIIAFVIGFGCTPKTAQRKPGKHSGSAAKIKGYDKQKKPPKIKKTDDFFIDQSEQVIEESEKEEKKRLKAQKKQAEQGYAQEKEVAEAAEENKKRPRKINTGKYTFY